MDLLIDFIIEHQKYFNRERISEYVKEHQKYGTIDYAINELGEIIAFVRWNVKNDIFEVLDFAVREDFRNRRIGKDFILRGLNKFNNIKWLEFKRGKRNQHKRRLKIDKILNRNIF